MGNNLGTELPSYQKAESLFKLIQDYKNNLPDTQKLLDGYITLDAVIGLYINLAGFHNPGSQEYQSNQRDLAVARLLKKHSVDDGSIDLSLDKMTEILERLGLTGLSSETLRSSVRKTGCYTGMKYRLRKDDNKTKI